MLGGSHLAIGISLILRDQFSGKMATARQELDKTQRAAERAERQSLQANTNVATAGAIAGVTALGAMREWVKVGANFDKQMTYTYSIVDKTGKAGSETLDRLKQKAMDVGKDTMFSSTEVAGAMTTMAQAGQDYDQILGNINSTAVLAAATMSGIEQSSSAMNDIMIGFDLPATEKESMRVADIITKTINDSNIALDSYAETMKYVIPTARTLGITLEEVSAITSVLGNAGLKGSMAGTGTENMVRLLAIAAGKEKGTKEYGALATMGLSPKDLTDAKGNLKPIQEILGLIGNGLQNLPDVQRTKVITDLLNIRGGRPGQLLTFANGLTKFSTALDSIHSSGGTAQKTADDVMGTLWGGMERLESTWETFKISFTEAIMPVLVPALKVITELLQLVVSFMTKPIGKILTAIAAGFILIKTISFGYRAILGSIRLLTGQLGVASATTAAQTVAGYGRMTLGANRYTASVRGAAAATERLAMANSMSAGAMGPAMWNAKRGQWTSNGWGIGRDKAVMQRWYQRYGSGAKMARANNFLGKASPYAMIGGLAMSMGQDAVGADTGAGKALGIGSAALSGGSMGVMLGSVIPGVGNVVGGIIGAVGGVAWELYNQAEAEKQRIEALKSEAQSALQPTLQGEDWARQAKAYLTMRSKAYAYAGYFENNPHNVAAYQQMYAPQLLGPNAQQQQILNQNRITINVDGTRAFDKMIQQDNYTANLQYGF